VELAFVLTNFPDLRESQPDAALVKTRESTIEAVPSMKKLLAWQWRFRNMRSDRLEKFGQVEILRVEVILHSKS
jgi:hypothetical protein